MTFNTYVNSQTVPPAIAVGLKCVPGPSGMTLTLVGQEGELVYAFMDKTAVGATTFVDSAGTNFGQDGTYEFTQPGQAAVFVFTGGQWWVMGEAI